MKLEKVTNNTNRRIMDNCQQIINYYGFIYQCKSIEQQGKLRKEIARLKEEIEYLKTKKSLSTFFNIFAESKIK
jgi:hypothetical protein